MSSRIQGENIICWYHVQRKLFSKLSRKYWGFLAVQDSSIVDIVTHSLTHSETFDFSVYNDYNDYSDYNDYLDYNNYNNYNDYRDSDLYLDWEWFSDLVT